MAVVRLVLIPNVQIKFRGVRLDLHVWEGVDFHGPAFCNFAASANAGGATVVSTRGCTSAGHSNSRLTLLPPLVRASTAAPHTCHHSMQGPLSQQQHAKYTVPHTYTCTGAHPSGMQRSFYCLAMPTFVVWRGAGGRRGQNGWGVHNAFNLFMIP